MTGSDHSDRFPRGVEQPPLEAVSETDQDDEIVAIIATAAHDAGTAGVSGGALMRAVKDATGSGSHALTVADDMVAAGLLRTDPHGRYYRKESA